MLTVTVPGVEYFDDDKQEFITTDTVVLELEHSLVSLSKWESSWEKPFLGPDEKTTEQTIDYVRCMVLTPNVPPEVFSRLTNDNFHQINEYINAKMTATWFNEPPGGRAKKPTEVITSELIYYWMVAHGIPFECENWHLARLFTLIQVCNVKKSPEKKMGRRESLEQRRLLNAQRRAQHGTRG